MRIPDEIRDCVCFLNARWGQKWKTGTAFFVGVPLGLGEGIEERYVNYLVTAQHCVLQDKQLPDELHVRVNTVGGRAIAIRVNPAMWLKHPKADCAVLPVIFDTSNLDIRLYPITSAATDEVVKERKIGAGDEAFLTGQLVHHPGVSRIIPIVRQGTIAAVPEDPVRIGTGGGDVEDVVTLMEIHSIGGISGSPVFAHLPFWRDVPKNTVLIGQGATASSGGTNFLLGVMHGFYPVSKNDPEQISEGVHGDTENSGIAVIVRVDRILDLINHPIQMKAREGAKKLIQLQSKPTPTGGASAEPKTAEFERFEEALKTVLSVPKEQIDEDIQREREQRKS